MALPIAPDERARLQSGAAAQQEVTKLSEVSAMKIIASKRTPDVSCHLPVPCNWTSRTLRQQGLQKDLDCFWIAPNATIAFSGATEKTTVIPRAPKSIKTHTQRKSQERENHQHPFWMFPVHILCPESPGITPALPRNGMTSTSHFNSSTDKAR